MNTLMMNEPGYTPGCTGSHKCNLLSTKFAQVGIGIYYDGHTTWLTEDFIL
jgi:hypothetical protein